MNKIWVPSIGGKISLHCVGVELLILSSCFIFKWIRLLFFCQRMFVEHFVWACTFWMITFTQILILSLYSRIFLSPCSFLTPPFRKLCSFRLSFALSCSVRTVVYYIAELHGTLFLKIRNMWLIYLTFCWIQYPRETVVCFFTYCRYFY